jgi:hypothetical protein
MDVVCASYFVTMSFAHLIGKLLIDEFYIDCPVSL